MAALSLVRFARASGARPGVAMSPARPCLVTLVTARSILSSVFAAALLAGCGNAGSKAPQAAAAADSVATDSLAAPGETHLRNIRQLTFGGNNAEAYFSRDGKQLIFQRQPDITTGCDQQFIMNTDGTGLHQVSNGEGRTTCGYFYNNDRRILYSSTYAFAPACPPPVDHSRGYVWPLGHFEIYTANADGSDPKPLTHNGAYNAESTVSPDGSRIIFTSTRDGDIELYTMNVDGSGVRRITHRVGYDGGAFFSPDGTQIVWRAQYPVTAADTADYRTLLKERMVRPSQLELWVANADGSNARQVTHLGGANFAPFFAPDGKRIIFASNYENPRGRDFDLYMVNVDGTGLEKITTSPDFDAFPMFSPDGKQLVWASNRHAAREGETNLFIADWVE
jgi:Tol biopolymer transport system component